MFKNINLSQIVSIVVISLFIGVVFVYANWSSPPASPPGCPSSNSACNAPINVSKTSQYKAGALGVGGVFQAFGAAVFNRSVGIGITNPTAMLDVAGTVQSEGYFQSNASALTTYKINTRRYMVDVTPNYVGRVVRLKRDKIMELCEDDDGCKVTIAMVNWDDDNKPYAVASRFENFFISRVTQILDHGVYSSTRKHWWRFSNNDIEGADNDGITNEWRVWDCYFTDAEAGSFDNNRFDDYFGFGALNVKGGNFSDTTTICRFIFED